MKNLSQTILTVAAVLLATSSCNEDGAAVEGILLEIDAPISVKDAAIDLRVRISSGPADDLTERGDETVYVTEWPAEVFVRASDTRRRWLAEAWALDDDGEVIAAGGVVGSFARGRTARVPLNLEEGASKGIDAGAREPERDAAAEPVAVDSGIPKETGVVGRVDARTNDSSSQASRDSGERDVGVDATRPLPVDSGFDPPQEAAASGGECATNYSATTPCAKCTCTECKTQVSNCFASSEPAKNTNCATLNACAERNHCAGESCYCGSSLLCLNPDGPCKSEIEMVANASGPLDVQNASNDSTSSVARAIAVSDCALANCRVDCGL
jgi:hypothetical protein